MRKSENGAVIEEEFPFEYIGFKVIESISKWKYSIDSLKYKARRLRLGLKKYI